MSAISELERADLAFAIDFGTGLVLCSGLVPQLVQ
jgi:hypothetical protein